MASYDEPCDIKPREPNTTPPLTTSYEPSPSSSPSSMTSPQFERGLWAMLFLFGPILFLSLILNNNSSRSQQLQTEQAESLTLTGDEAMAASASSDPELRGLMRSFVLREGESYLRVPAPPDLKRRAAEELRRSKLRKSTETESP